MVGKFYRNVLKPWLVYAISLSIGVGIVIFFFVVFDKYFDHPAAGVGGAIIGYVLDSVLTYFVFIRNGETIQF